MGSPEPRTPEFCKQHPDLWVPCPHDDHFPAAPSPVTEHVIEARGDEYPTPGESMPIESGGWWTPYTETSWGYFRFAIRPVEQPDGFLMFWHDAEGAHTSAVILDPAAAPSPVTGEPADSDLLRFAKAITEYGSHHGNCPYESWNKGLTRCKCGLFRLIKDAERLLAASGDRPREEPMCPVHTFVRLADCEVHGHAASPESEG